VTARKSRLSAPNSVITVGRRVAPMSMVATKTTTISTHLWDGELLGAPVSLSWAVRAHISTPICASVLVLSCICSRVPLPPPFPSAISGRDSRAAKAAPGSRQRSEYHYDCHRELNNSRGC
jgi:hypothetical protein